MREAFWKDVLIVVTLAACCVPARRAAFVSPIDAIRAE
jgi:ABC-type antimicrobial peptide transport system permease subunit